MFAKITNGTEATCQGQSILERASSSATLSRPFQTSPHHWSYTAEEDFARHWPRITYRKWDTPIASRWTAAGAHGPRRAFPRKKHKLFFSLRTFAFRGLRLSSIGLS